MRLTRIALIALLVVTVVSSVACSYPDAYVSSINCSWDYTMDHDSCNRFIVEATIKNIGGAGYTTIYCSAIPQDNNSAVDDVTPKSTKIYLDKGEETTLQFYFWARGTINYRAQCQP